MLLLAMIKLLVILKTRKTVSQFPKLIESPELQKLFISLSAASGSKNSIEQP